MSNRKVLRTGSAPGAIGPYSQAIAAGGFLFVSGQIPLDPGTGRLVEGGIGEQVGRVLENLKAVLQAGGAGMETVVRTTVYLTDLSEFPQLNEIYARYFGSDPPARTTVQVSALPKGARVEIDAIAAL
jgi:2-iminobutanoate/2-iminopropanoate deaminase